MHMNISGPVTKNSYSEINELLHTAYVEASALSMSAAAENIRETTGEKEQVGDCAVSVDGTWQKRGFASRTGVVIGKDNGKCIDYQVTSKHCKGCKVWPKKDSPDYPHWERKQKKWQAIYKQSSWAMEGSGAVAMFQRYVDQNKLRYLEYVGDGDIFAQRLTTPNHMELM